MYATVEELEARWRTLSAPERVRADVLLQDAAVRIDIECPPTIPVTDEAARKIISCEMVKRAMANPAGIGVTQYSETTGPFTDQVTYANPSGDMYLTKADRRLLRCGSQVAFTVPMVSRDEDVLP